MRCSSHPTFSCCGSWYGATAWEGCCIHEPSFPPDCQVIFIERKEVMRGLSRATHREAGMHDIVIRGGTIMDGTGKAAFTGDVAIAEGRITEGGGKQGPARREIDATGLMVTPGWV